MAGLAGFGQGFSNAINANAQNNQADAQTRILGLHQESLRRQQLGDVYGARALKLMADQLAGQSGIGGGPPVPMATPPMPGTASVPMQQGPAIQTAPAPAPMQGAPLPPYQGLDQATQGPLMLGAGGSDTQPLSVSAPPVGLNPDKALGVVDKPGLVGGRVVQPGDVGAARQLGLDAPEHWGYSMRGEAEGQQGAPPAPAPAASPAQGAPAAVPGTASATGAAPTQQRGQAPFQVNPQTGLPQGPQLANNLNALNAIRALKQIGAPDDVIMSALGHMEPIFAQEYKATIAAQHAALQAYQAQMTNAYHQGRLEESAANRESRENIKAQESEDRNRRTEALIEKWKGNRADTQRKLDIYQQSVDKRPDQKDPAVMQFNYQKQLSNKAHHDLDTLWGAFSKSIDKGEKATISQQILDKQNEIDGYTKSMVDSFDQLNSNHMERPAGSTTSGVPVPPAKGAAGAPRVTATNPKTGEKVELRDGKWVPLQQ